VNGVGELHSTTLEVTMDSFFSGVQLHFTIDQKHLLKYLKEILEECFTARRIAGLPICKVTYFYLYFLKIRFVGMIEDFGRLLMQQPVPVFVLLGFHFLIKASVVICFVHSEHLLQNRNSRLISFENQAAMYAIFSSANWKLPGSRHALC